ncbi:MAG: hypothetical protein IT422_17625 [Pirellulaceae bacterium]|jgi:hypothetical protein|nr:hypothetical protein [Pirellulaceae bacterium]
MRDTTRCFRQTAHAIQFALWLSLSMKLAAAAAAPQAADDDRITRAVPQATGADGLQKTASWNWPDVAVYEQQLLSFLDQHAASPELRQQVELFWKETESADRGPALLDRLLDVGGLIEPRIAELNAQLRSTTADSVYPGKLTWLSSDVPGWLQDTVRLACGRSFGQRKLYDESLESLSGLETSTVCDPATLLFYRAAAEHHLLKKDECLANVKLLLERESELPSRFAIVGKLIAADIEPLAEDSLDEVARLMQDVHRRLDLGRAGTRVRDQEQQIVDKLDKLIEKIEEQMQQQMQQQQQPSGSPSPAQMKPMDDSQIAGGRGPGDVDNRDNGDRSGWGNLPPAQRQESLQRLTEELPSHYREVIEGYFRQLAKEKR